MLYKGPKKRIAGFVHWLDEQCLQMPHIQLDKPNQNAFSARGNHSYRHQWFTANMFADFDQAP